MDVKTVQLKTGIKLPRTFGSTSRFASHNYKLEINKRDKTVILNDNIIIPFDNVAYIEVDPDETK